MQRELLFPTSVYVDRIVLDDQKLLDSILQIRKTDPKGLERSNVGNSYHSRDDLHKLPEFKSISEGIIKTTQKVFEQEKIKTKFYIGNLWANINSQGGFNDLHTHGNSYLSGVYYVQTPENSGLLRFSDPRPQAIMIVPEMKADVEKEYWNRISFRGERGQIVLFPGYLPHQVLSNESNEERISLSFNIILDWNK